MGKVSSLSILDSGNYYTVNPTVTLSAPADSSIMNVLDSSNGHSYAKSALRHDSNDVTIFGTNTDSIGSSVVFTNLSFWFYLDSLEPCTLLWNEKFRVFVGNNQKLNIAYTVDSSHKDAFQSDNVQIRDTASLFVTANNWHHGRIEMFRGASLRIGLNSSYQGTYSINLNTNNNYLFDNGDVIRIGYDSGYTGPNHKENIGGQYVYDSDINKSFSGLINYVELTHDSSRFVYDDTLSATVPDSAGYTYNGITPNLSQSYDYFTATANGLIDSATGKLSELIITDSGVGYTSAPTVTITGGRSAALDSSYIIGDNITQTLSSGVEIRGEVQRYQLDSARDSSRYLYLAHVGADDGEFRSFVEDISINKTYPANTYGLLVTAVNEINTISETEQNDEFTANYVDDFLDFSEDNPFGDPENQ